MALIEWLIECLFYTVCGWLGHTVVWLVTLGRVDLPWGADAESILAEWIGVGSLILLGTVAVLFPRAGG